MVGLTAEQRSERQKRNSKKSDQRSRFEQDRDRIIYSTAFQRLAGITQIVRAGEADVFHTRQQHSLKVAQIGRRLAQKLRHDRPDLAEREGLDPEVVEAACLAHDLGHPPFGHIGEHELNRLVQSEGYPGGFEGNAQSFRILTKLAVRFDKEDCDGMDLTRATLAASIKYPWLRGREGKKHKKWSVYAEEKDQFDWVWKHYADERKTLEAEIMDWSDDLSYSVHDLEDFHRCNAIPWRQIFENPAKLIIATLGPNIKKTQRAWIEAEAAFQRLDRFFKVYPFLLDEKYEGSRDQREQLRRMTSELISRYMGAIAITESEVATSRVTIDPQLRAEVDILKQITRDYIIGNPALLAQQRGQSKIIEALFNEIVGSLKDGQQHPPAFLPIRMRYLHEFSPHAPAKFAADCIASLSEREAIALHARLFGLSSGSVLDPIVR